MTSTASTPPRFSLTNGRVEMRTGVALICILIFWLLLPFVAPQPITGRQSLLSWLWTQWGDPQWQHGMFALPFAILLAHQNRKWARRRLASGSATTVGFGIMLLGLFAVYAGQRLLVPLVSLLGLQGVLIGMALSAQGYQAMKTWLPAILLLSFAWPLPILETELGLPMRILSSKMTAFFLSPFSDLGILRHGTELSILGGDGARMGIDVEPACSGLRGLFSIAMGAYVIAFLHQHRWHHVCLLLAASVVLAIIGNALRLSIIVGATRFLGPDFAIGKDGGTSSFHMSAGMITIALAIVVLLFLSRRFEQRASRRPRRKFSKPKQELPQLKATAPLLGATCLTLVLAAHLHGESELLPGAASQLRPLPSQVSGLAELVPEDDLDGPRALPEDTVVESILYTGEGFPEFNPLEAIIVRTGANRRGIHRPEVCLGAQGWKIHHRESLILPLPDGRSLPCRYLALSQPTPSGAELVHAHYVYWFQAGEVATSSHFKRVGLSAKDALTANENLRWASVNFFTPAEKGTEGTLPEYMERALTSIADGINAGHGTLSTADLAEN